MSNSSNENRIDSNEAAADMWELQRELVEECGWFGYPLICKSCGRTLAEHVPEQAECSTGFVCPCWICADVAEVLK